MAGRAEGAAARRLVRRLDELGRVSDETDALTRTFLSPAMRRANALVGDWMSAAGLAVREDGIGNLIGRIQFERPQSRPGARGPRAPTGRSGKTFVLGGHLDTVRDAGRFDGTVGVLLGLAAIEEVLRRGIQLPFALEVVGFAEEEGVRFSSAYLGSKGYIGALQKRDLARVDADGVSVAAAVAQRDLGPLAAAHRRADLVGFLEVHIEQGPVLEAAGLPVGIVTAIAGQTRVLLRWRGQAGHAGTTPMHLRRDALAAAAEFVLCVEALAKRERDLIATVGILETRPGAANVIPGEVLHSLDVRHPDDSLRKRALGGLCATAEGIARARGLKVDWAVKQQDDAVVASPELVALLRSSVRSAGIRPLSLPSGAGHDAVVMSRVAPVSMLFVRCRDGLSHHPGEYAAPKDLATALEVTVGFLERLAGS